MCVCAQQAGCGVLERNDWPLQQKRSRKGKGGDGAEKP